MQHLHPTIAAAQPERQAEQARALAHYAGMAAQAALIDSPVAEHLRRINEGKRRATDERVNRIALMRLAIDNLVKANLLALEAALEPPEDQARCAALLESTRARVESLLERML